jgi:cytoplasmic iron level regulating protein YaaA (DUF328/UPF0246 family)
MITLLSPAKKLNMSPYAGAVDVSQPRLKFDLAELTATAKKQSQGDLKRLMHLSDNLAKLNFERFDAFDPENQAEGMKPAALAFDGDVYWGLEAKSLSDDDLAYAQDNLRILSGLYGLLRPMDEIQPYRLEMGTRLKNPRGNTLYDFWGDTIQNTLREDLAGHEDQTILNLASNEYFKSVKAKTLGHDVISVKFLEEKDGKSRPIQYYTKFGRGLLARWVIQNRIERAEDLTSFAENGYKFVAERSTERELVFERPQPPKKS